MDEREEEKRLLAEKARKDEQARRLEDEKALQETMALAGGYDVGEIVKSLINCESEDHPLAVGDVGTVKGPATNGETSQILVQFESGTRVNMQPTEVKRLPFPGLPKKHDTNKMGLWGMNRWSKGKDATIKNIGNREDTKALLKDTGGGDPEQACDKDLAVCNARMYKPKAKVGIYTITKVKLDEAEMKKRSPDDKRYEAHAFQVRMGIVASMVPKWDTSGKYPVGIIEIFNHCIHEEVITKQDSKWVRGKIDYCHDDATYEITLTKGKVIHKVTEDNIRSVERMKSLYPHA